MNDRQLLVIIMMICGCSHVDRGRVGSPLGHFHFHSALGPTQSVSYNDDDVQV